MLSTLDHDTDATTIAAHIIRQLGQPVPEVHHFPTTSDWFSQLSQPNVLPSGFPKRFIDKAYQISLALHQDKREMVLLHGDLHHFNILSAQRQPWIAIDPKGVIGEFEYEVGAYLRNPIPDIAANRAIKKILHQRIDQFSELLGFDNKRIAAWGFAQAVLAAVWCLESQSDDWLAFLTCANALSEKVTC